MDALARRAEFPPDAVAAVAEHFPTLIALSQAETEVSAAATGLGAEEVASLRDAARELLSRPDILAVEGNRRRFRQTLDDLGLPAAAIAALGEAGVETFEHLPAHSEAVEGVAELDPDLSWLPCVDCTEAPRRDLRFRPSGWSLTTG